MEPYLRDRVDMLIHDLQINSDHMSVYDSAGGMFDLYVSITGVISGEFFHFYIMVITGTNNYKIDHSCVTDCRELIDWLLSEYRIYNC